ncbi:MAG: zinc-dependent peptidase [Cytophagaceae bacterium]
MEFVVVILLTAAFGVCTSMFLGLSSVVFQYFDDRVQLLKPLKPAYRRFLNNNFSYYANLDPYRKRDFEKRLKYFLFHKQFVARNMRTVTEEMKLMIGACAVQLTFGFRPLKLAHFSKIVLYPKEYYSVRNRRRHKHKGQVNSNGMIVFSWEDFLKGYKIGDDGYNLGLHEMAHALRLEDAIINEEYAFIEVKDLHHWNRVASREFYKIKMGEPSFLRTYAGTNMEEFFAVCVEQFFEQPEDFSQELPQLYEATCAMLRQDPLSGMVYNDTAIYEDKSEKSV